jgi:hypothetical protein
MKHSRYFRHFIHTLLPAAFMLIFTITPAGAQEVSVNVQSSKSQYLIGEYAPVYIRANADRMLKIRWPELNDTLAEGLKILKIEPIDTVIDPDGIAHYLLTYIVSAYDTGRYIIHPITFHYQPYGTNEVRTSSTAYLTLFFKSVPVDEQSDFRDIKGPMDSRWSQWEIALLTLALLVILVAFWFIIRHIRRRNKTAPLPEKQFTAAPREPWEIALETLEALRQSPLLANGLTKLYWTELSGLLREYIHAGLHINAPELTTHQTIKRLAAHPIMTTDLLTDIRSILQLADMVKFAKAAPEMTESITMTDIAATFITGTAPAHVSQDAESREGQP